MTHPLTFMADKFRDAGLTVVEEPGWRTRGGDFYGPDGYPIGGMQHHTAPPVPFPVSNLYATGRVKANYNVKPDGTVHVIAAGACNYSSGSGSSIVRNETRAGIAPTGTALQRGLVDNAGGNHWYVNNETDHAGDGRPIPTPQYRACVTAWTIICNHFGWTQNRIISHGEWTRRKIDPYWNGRDAHRNLADMRRDIQLALANQPIEPPDPGDDDVQAVTLIQQALVDAGYNIGDFGPNNDGVDGEAGPSTLAGLTKAFSDARRGFWRSLRAKRALDALTDQWEPDPVE